MIQIPAQKPHVSKNISAESIGSGSEQISDDASVSAPCEVPSIAMGAESQDNAVSTTLPPQMLVQHLQDSTSGIDIQCDLIGKYNSDLVFHRILENPKHFKNFEVSDGLIFLKQRGIKLLCIPNVKIKEHSVCELVISEAHSLFTSVTHFWVPMRYINALI